MPISWNEIRHNAIKFSREWAGATSESAEKQSFWNDFFQVFGIKRRLVASFEEAVKKISGEYGYIDLFWPGVLLVEHKGFGKDLRKAETQAFDYIRELASDPKRRDEIPRYIIVIRAKPGTKAMTWKRISPATDSLCPPYKSVKNKS
jgi:hypothetical protein